jgi:tRNA threonylcarbamoyladenosine dehydratase
VRSSFRVQIGSSVRGAQRHRKICIFFFIPLAIDFAMAASTKSDPTHIQIVDLSAIHYDPLTRAVPQHLRTVLSCSERSSPSTPPSLCPSSADADADDDSSAPSPGSSAREYSIPVVYLSEVPGDDVTLLLLANSELTMGSVDELAPLRDFRVRILPVLGPLPALFGLHIAMYVLCELAGRASEQATLARVPS